MMVYRHYRKTKGVTNRKPKELRYSAGFKRHKVCASCLFGTRNNYFSSIMLFVRPLLRSTRRRQAYGRAFEKLVFVKHLNEQKIRAKTSPFAMNTRKILNPFSSVKQTSKQSVFLTAHGLRTKAISRARNSPN